MFFIAQSYDDLEPNFAPGAGRFIRYVQSRRPQVPRKSDAANGVTGKLETAGEQTQSFQTAERGADKRAAPTPGAIASIEADQDAGPNSPTNSQIAVAEIYNVSNPPGRRIIKNGKPKRA